MIIDGRTHAGCYADGSLGHDHLRERLAELLEEIGTEDSELIASLRGPMPDDAWDEDEAVDHLNGVTVHGVWAFIDGDLVLECEDTEEEDHATDC